MIRPDLSPVIEHTPQAWQIVAGQRVPVKIGYRLSPEGEIGFALEAYDPTRPLVIDPTLDYFSYAGGSGFDGAASVVLDENNHLFVAGSTSSADFPSSPAPTIAGQNDVVVLKFDLSRDGADQLEFVTFVGGSANDMGYGIGIDTSGNIYVTGKTDSSNLPVTPNAYQSAYQGSMDGFAMQLDPTGAVRYVSYLGGSDFEEPVQMTVTPDGRMAVVGFTSSADYPVTGNAYQPVKGSQDWNGDALISILDPAQSGAASLVYSSFLGGTLFDECYAVAVSGNKVYLGGNTRSTDFPLAAPVQATNAGGQNYGDAFFAVLDISQPQARQLEFSTFLGGSGEEVSGGLALDQAGDLYWVGISESPDFPNSTAGVNSAGTDFDTFLVKVDPRSKTIIYSTLIGGSADDGLRGVLVDNQGYVYVTGGTGSPDFPLVEPIYSEYKGGVAPEQDYSWYGPGDGLVGKYDPEGHMIFSTLLNGSGPEFVTGLALDSAGNLVVVGGTRSTDLAPVNAFQASNLGGFSMFIARFDGLEAFGEPTPTPEPSPTLAPTPVATQAQGQPSQPSQETPTVPGDTSSKFPATVILVVGALAGLLVIGVVVWFVLRRMKK